MAVFICHICGEQKNTLGHRCLKEYYEVFLKVFCRWCLLLTYQTFIKQQQQHQCRELLLSQVFYMTWNNLAGGQFDFTFTATVSFDFKKWKKIKLTFFFNSEKCDIYIKKSFAKLYHKRWQEKKCLGKFYFFRIFKFKLSRRHPSPTHTPILSQGCHLVFFETVCLK